ncbi:MAG: hypothetical protein R6U13_08940 [Desulfatiglandaceae bacterium]
MLVDQFINAYEQEYGLTRGEVVESILTDWCARCAAEVRAFGRTVSTSVSPFLWYDDGELLAGDELFTFLSTKYSEELAE